jgi:hypothetical protein
MRSFTLIALTALTASLPASAQYAQPSLPSIDIGSYSTPSGGQTVAWAANTALQDVCSGNRAVITGSDGGCAAPLCGTQFALNGIENLSLACEADGVTVNGINQNGTLTWECFPPTPASQGYACADGVELTQTYGCTTIACMQEGTCLGKKAKRGERRRMRV